MSQSFKKVIVTGGAGFIGSHLCELLLQQGHHIIALDNLATGRISNISHLQVNKQFEFIQVDIRDYHSLYSHFEHTDWVFHLAGLADIVPSIEKPEEYYQTNVTGTFNILECAKAWNVKRFIYAASSSCYGIPNEFPTQEHATVQPEYPYALTKYLGECLVLHWEKVFKLPSISLRLFNVYGPRSRTTGAYGAVFGVFLAQKLHKKPFTVVGDGRQTRDFTFVTDVAEAFIKAAESNISGDIFNVGSGDHYSINHLVSLLGGDSIHIPKRPGEPDCTYADITKIRKFLNWEPKVTFESGVKIMLDHIQLWKDAPVWNENSISKATETWFKYLEPTK